MHEWKVTTERTSTERERFPSADPFGIEGRRGAQRPDRIQSTRCAGVPLVGPFLITCHRGAARSVGRIGLGGGCPRLSLGWRNV